MGSENEEGDVMWEKVEKVGLTWANGTQAAAALHTRLAFCNEIRGIHAFQEGRAGCKTGG